MLWWRPRGPHGRHRLGQADVISSYPLLMSALEPLAQLRAATVASPNVGLHPIDVAVADAPVYPTRRARRSVGPFHPRDGPRTRTAARQPRWADPEDQAGRDRLVVAVVAGTATLGDLMTGSSACSTFGATSAVGARERRPCEASAAPASWSRLLLDDVPSVLAQCPPNGAAPKGREVDVRLQRHRRRSRLLGSRGSRCSVERLSHSLDRHQRAFRTPRFEGGPHRNRDGRTGTKRRSQEQIECELLRGTPSSAGSTVAAHRQTASPPLSASQNSKMRPGLIHQGHSRDRRHDL